MLHFRIQCSPGELAENIPLFDQINFLFSYSTSISIAHKTPHNNPQVSRGYFYATSDPREISMMKQSPLAS